MWTDHPPPLPANRTLALEPGVSIWMLAAEEIISIS